MRRRSRALSVLMILTVCVAIALLASHLIDRLLASPAFASGGHPALTGGWIGSLTTATGRQRGVYPPDYR